MDGAKVGIFKQSNQVRLCCLLQRQYCMAGFHVELQIQDDIESGSGLTAEDKRVMRQRTKETKKKGKGNEIVAEEEAKPPRTTHKLLQKIKYLSLAQRH
ncbi:hypothetical protein F3Y22_tig00116971pilonHSYRG00212 [Hibiscus syriacus]|uniref:Uncharacterized protein n=1 Tax=Hibiscus syriacus TaxID=106335 RepID=A0A6A2WTW9_HIBSY|nr:hypothetical protein F3Y22_tig00116971pilonHSYRG00212 [Hibiscus syriacus]